MERNDASERVAEKFTRMMNATPSRFGVLSDVATASAISAAILVVELFALRHSPGLGWRNLALFVAALPIAGSLLVSAALKGSRERVVEWLASLPFPVDNLNALLAGTSDVIEVSFAPGAALPPERELAATLDLFSGEVLLLALRKDTSSLEIKLGVIDSKRLPLLTNHRRYRRFLELVERVLLPLARAAPIEVVRML